MAVLLMNVIAGGFCTSGTNQDPTADDPAVTDINFYFYVIGFEG